MTRNTTAFLLILSDSRKVSVLPLLQMDKLRVRRVKRFAGDHGTVKWWAMETGFQPIADLIWNLCSQQLNHIVKRLGRDLFLSFVLKKFLILWWDKAGGDCTY